MKSHRIKLDVGKMYRNRNGSVYICEELLSLYDARMKRATDGWTLVAHGICQYEDGTIEWDYSTGGHWLQKKGTEV